MLQRLQHLRVATQLSLAFGIVLLMLGGQSALEFMSARDSKALLSTTVAQARAKQDLAMALHDAALQEELQTRAMGLLVDQSEIETASRQVRAVRGEIGQGIAALEHLALDAQESTMVRRIDELTAHSQADRDHLLELAAAMDVDKSNAFYDGSLKKVDTERRALTARFLDLQKTQSAAAFRKIGDLSNRLLAATLVCTLAVAAVCALAGWLLYRTISRPLERVAALASRAADGDLSARFDTESTNEFGNMQRALGRMAERTRSALAEIRRSSHSIMLASGEIAAGSVDFSGRTQSQAANLQSAASSIEHVANAARHCADAARQADGLASAATSAARAGGQEVDRIVSKMQSISQSSREIAEIVGVIKGIAFQTNILALNAAVEAAGAGEHGRGFSVVASEVRSLAQRSASAAGQIEALVRGNVDTVREGEELVGEAGAAVATFIQSSERVSAVVAEISASTIRLASGTEHINDSVSQIDHGVQQNAVLARQSAAAARGLEDQVAMLHAAMERFRFE